MMALWAAIKDMIIAIGIGYMSTRITNNDKNT